MNLLKTIKNLRFLLTCLALLFVNITSAQIEICNNGIDDDGDGQTDILDPDCACGVSYTYNYIPNPNFEQKTDCCSELDGDINCLDSWVVLENSPLFIDTICEPILAEEREAFYGVDITGDVLQLEFSQEEQDVIGVCLNQPLVKEGRYIFEAKRVLHDLPLSKISGKFSIYGLENCEDLYNHLYDDPTCELQGEELGSIELGAIFEGQWYFSYAWFTPDINIEAIYFKIRCETDIVGEEAFLLLDSLELRKTGDPWYKNQIFVDGFECKDSFALYVEDREGLDYQWYFEDELLIGETSSRLERLGGKDLEEGRYQCVMQYNGECISIPYGDIAKPPNCPEICDNMIDDDDDGKIDLLDEDCICVGFEYIPNGGFEEKEGCCGQGLNGENNCLYDWIMLRGSPDLSDPDCHFFGNNNTVMTFLSVSSFSENFGACLNAELEMDQDYTFRTAMKYKNTLDLQTVGKMVIYGVETCSTLLDHTFNEEICPLPLIELCSFNFEDYPEESWQNLELNFTAPSTIGGIAVRLDCENDNFLANATVFMDDLSIRETVVWNYEDSIELEGSICDSMVNLSVPSSDMLAYQWFLESDILADEISSQIDIGTENPALAGMYECLVTNTENGCSEIVEFELNFAASSLEILEEMVCVGAGYVFGSDTFYNEGSYYDTMQTVYGCDSIQILNLSFFTLDSTYQELSICEGDTVDMNDQVLTNSGIYYSDLITENGCDSTLVFIVDVHTVTTGDTVFIELTEEEYYIHNEDTIREEAILLDTVPSAEGCDSIVVTSLIFEQCSLEIEVQNGAVSCFGNEDGFIEINLSDTEIETQISIDGGQNFSNNLSYYDLTPGNYEIVVQYQDACLLEYGNLTIAEPSELTANMESFLEIEKGDSIGLELTDSNFDPVSYLWESTDNIECNNCSKIIVSPTETTDYYLLLEDENGCTFSLHVLIEVRESASIFIPNTFTPNDDGINDNFTVFGTSESKAEIDLFVIYDRWGNNIHREEKVQVQDLVGWNGQFNGQKVQNGVYTYFLQYTNDKNELVKHKGSVVVHQ